MTPSPCLACILELQRERVAFIRHIGDAVMKRGSRSRCDLGLRNGPCGTARQPSARVNTVLRKHSVLQSMMFDESSSSGSAFWRLRFQAPNRWARGMHKCIAFHKLVHDTHRLMSLWHSRMTKVSRGRLAWHGFPSWPHQSFLQSNLLPLSGRCLQSCGGCAHPPAVQGQGKPRGAWALKSRPLMSGQIC